MLVIKTEDLFLKQFKCKKFAEAMNIVRCQLVTSRSGGIGGLQGTCLPSSPISIIQCVQIRGEKLREAGNYEIVNYIELNKLADAFKLTNYRKSLL